jgi:ankyrin repeat protein
MKLINITIGLHLLCKKGPDVLNFKRWYGMHIIHAAVFFTDQQCILDILEILVNNEIDLKSVDYNGDNILHYACRKINEDVTLLIKQKNFKNKLSPKKFNFVSLYYQKL